MIKSLRNRLGARLVSACVRVVALVAVAAMLLVSIGTLPACGPGAGMMAAGGIKVAMNGIADLTACSAAASGPLATYLSGNLDGAKSMVEGAKGGSSIVRDVLCALHAVANAIPAGMALSGGGVTAGTGAATGAGPLGRIETTGASPGGFVPQTVIPPETRAAAATLLTDLCKTSGMTCVTCVTQTNGRALRPGEKLCGTP